MADQPIRTFAGYRPEPPGEYVDKAITNAGTAPDYHGVIFPDGTVVIRWATTYQSHSVWACWDDFLHVHGHPEYGTRLVFHDGGQPPGEPEPDTPVLILETEPSPGPCHCPDCGHRTASAAYRGLWSCADCFQPRTTGATGG